MRFSIRGLMRFGLFLVVAPAAFATSWYVNGVSGSDSNNCLSPTTACKTIGHAISLAASGDSIMVAAATYNENLTISISLKVIGSGAAPTIIDGEQAGSVVFIPNTAGPVSLSKVTIQNGDYSKGGGVYNAATLTISNSTVSGNIAGYKLGPPEGGGIYNAGALTINNSTIANNSAGGLANKDRAAASTTQGC